MTHSTPDTSDRLSRRAALGALASVPALALPIAAVAAADPSPALATLIENHRAARAAFRAATARADAAEPPADAFVLGIGGKTRHSLSLNFVGVGQMIERDFAREMEALKTLSRVNPALGEQAVAALVAERDAAITRRDEAFAASNAASNAADEADAVEDAAMMALCSHRCTTPGELATKARYLAAFRNELTAAHLSAIFASQLPEGEDLAAIAR